MVDTLSLSSFITGLTLGGSLIMAIGAQNAFVLRQGVRGEHVVAVVALCAVLDIALMAIGIGSADAVGGLHPRLLDAAAWGGAAMLGWYGLAAFRRACNPHALQADAAGGARSVRRVLAQTLGISLLNPHVYLDTVVLVGTIGARQAAGTQGAFLVGSGLASVLWFAALGLGARVVAPLFARPAAWRVLDAGIGVTMWWIALRLAQGSLGGGAAARSELAWAQ
jgi:L-lysine exporter family protein LysE/ArgO